MGVAKWRIIRTIWYGFVNEEETAESKGYAESPEFSPALGLLIFGRSVATIRSLVCSITIFFC